MPAKKKKVDNLELIKSFDISYPTTLRFMFLCLSEAVIKHEHPDTIKAIKLLCTKLNREAVCIAYNIDNTRLMSKVSTLEVIMAPDAFF